ncbi:MAG: hypothetical protein ACXQTX_04730 [Candidatus Syntropharchaeia archaeon]
MDEIWPFLYAFVKGYKSYREAYKEASNFYIKVKGKEPEYSALLQDLNSFLENVGELDIEEFVRTYEGLLKIMNLLKGVV